MSSCSLFLSSLNPLDNPHLEFCLASIGPTEPLEGVAEQGGTSSGPVGTRLLSHLTWVTWPFIPLLPLSEPQGPHLNVLSALKGPSSPVVPARVHPLLSKPRTHGKVPRAVAGMAEEEGRGEEGGQPRRPTPASNSRAGIPVEQQLAGLGRPE